MLYKNTSCSEKTFHGVTFKPGEVHDVSDYINNIAMIPVSELSIETNSKFQQKLSDKPKKASHDTKTQAKEVDAHAEVVEPVVVEEQVD